MAQATDQTAHHAVLTRTDRWDGKPIFQLHYMCQATPESGDIVTTAAADVTCSACREALGGVGVGRRPATLR